MGWRSRSKTRRDALKSGYRSGFEVKIADQLTEQKIDPKKVYETTKINYIVPERQSTYTVDFTLPNGILIETKGRWTTEDRKKHLLIKKQHPELDIRFVFTNSKRKLRKGAKSSYAEWCIKYEFRYYDRIIPEDWLKEKGKNKHSKFIKFKQQKIKRR